MEQSRQQFRRENTSFKTCPACGFEWPTREQFLEDPDLKLVGYQVAFKELTAGLFLFNHSCRGATLATRAVDFKDLHQGPVFTERATGSEDCPGHCLHQDDLQPCPAACECAFIREILQIIKNWPKANKKALA